jgi:ArsR family transcriptional regulator
MKKSECCPTPRKGPKKEFSEEELGNLCKAIGHPVRVKLVRMLIDRGECISGDLAEEFALAQSTVSEHLRILKEAGLVEGTIDGPRRCYCVNGKVLAALKEMIANI